MSTPQPQLWSRLLDLEQRLTSLEMEFERLKNRFETMAAVQREIAVSQLQKPQPVVVETPKTMRPGIKPLRANKIRARK
jgi:hypothetical protein